MSAEAWIDCTDGVCVLSTADGYEAQVRSVDEFRLAIHVTHEGAPIAVRPEAARRLCEAMIALSRADRGN